MDRASGQVSPQFPDNFKSEFWDINGAKVYSTKHFLMFINEVKLTPDEIITALHRVYKIVGDIGWASKRRLDIILEASDRNARILLNQTGMTKRSTAFHQSFEPVNHDGVELNAYVCLYPKKLRKIKKDLPKDLLFGTFVLATIAHEFSHAFGTTSSSKDPIDEMEREMIEELTDAVSFHAVFSDGNRKSKSLFWAFHYLYEALKKRGGEPSNQAYKDLSDLILVKNKR